MIKFEKPEMIALPKKELSRLLSAPEGCLKIYLYGYLHDSADMQKIMGDLGMEKSAFLDCLDYLEQGGYLSIDVTSDTTLRYAAAENEHPLSQEVYPDAQFNGLLQSLFTDRELNFRDLKAFYECTAVFGLPKNVVLMLAEYCIATHKRGNHLPSSYITQKAKEWAKQGIDSVEKAEERMNADSEAAAGAKEVLRLMGIRYRDPSEAETKLFEKWKNEWGMELPAIRSAMGELTKTGNPSMKYLDSILERLYSQKLTGSSQISEHFSASEKTDSAIKKLFYALSVPNHVVTAELREKYTKLCRMGFDEETMLFACRMASGNNKHSFSAMENLLYGWHEKQLTTLADIRAYEEKQAALSEKAKAMLSAIAIERRPTPQDIRLYTRFRSEYGYTDEVILFAAELAQTSANPIAALTAIMNRWHESGVKTLEEAKLANERFRGNARKADYEERQYTQEDEDRRIREALRSIEDMIHDDFADI